MGNSKSTHEFQEMGSTHESKENKDETDDKIQKHPLYVALRDNKVDDVRKELTKDRNVHFINKNHLYKLYEQIQKKHTLYVALRDNKVDDVRKELTKDRNVHFINKTHLHMLYEQVLGDSEKPIAQLIKNTIGYIKQSMVAWICCRDTGDGCKELADIGELIKHLLQDESLNSYKGHSDVHVTMHDLFIWATLTNRRELSRVLWSFGTRQLGTVLIGCALLKALAKKADSYGELELTQDLKNHAIMYEDMAVGVIGVCYNDNKTHAYNLLVRRMPYFGDKTLFSLSNSYSIKAFMDTSCCQTKLNLLWKGRMAPYTPTWKMILCAFLPIFILPCIRFPERKDEQQTKTIWSRTGEKIIHFYESPIIIFITYTFSYMVFLGIFTLFVLTDLHPGKISVYEMITWVWTFSLFLDEIRQLLCTNKGSLWYKVRGYFDSAWNWFDLIICLLFLVAVIVRHVDDDDFVWARYLYSVSLATFILRIMQHFLVQKEIGPKLIVLRNMLKDVVLFIGIFVVFLVSFGVMYQANLYPNAPQTWGLLASIVSVPYWQIYGELFLDEMRGEVDGGCTTNETLWRQEDGMTRCPEHRHLVPFLVAGYLLMSNILLVNLLIAMFSTTYQKVHDKSELNWRYYRYDVVHTLYHYPMLCPPLNILALVYRLVHYVLCTRNSTKVESSNEFSRKFHDHPELDTAEKEACDKYLQQFEEPENSHDGRSENSQACLNHRPPYCGCGYPFGPTSMPTSILLRNPEHYGY